MTGRGAGYCAGYDAPGYVNIGYGCGRGFGRRGRGWRHNFYATGLPRWAREYPVNPAWAGYTGPVFQGEFTPEHEVEALKAQSGFFQKQIDVLNERIKELEELTAKKKDSNV
jgi:hypothetical protein